jgi:hypothetical protein
MPCLSFVFSTSLHKINTQNVPFKALEALKWIKHTK